MSYNNKNIIINLITIIKAYLMNGFYYNVVFIWYKKRQERLAEMRLSFWPLQAPVP